MSIESLVAELGKISNNEMCRYMFIPNKTVDLDSLRRANIIKHKSARAVVKNVSYSNTPFYRLIYPFVSIENNDNDVTEAFKEAINTGVKDVIIGSNMLDYYSKVIPDFDKSKLQQMVEFTDYYSDLDTRFVEYNENKFIKQHKIRQFQNDIELRRLVFNDFYDVAELYSTWKESKQLHNTRSFNIFFDPDNFYRNINMNDKFIYGIFFKGKLITWGIINFHGTDNKIAYEEVQQCYNRNMLPPDFELTEENNKFISNIGQINYYYLYKYLKERGVKIVHCAGSATGNVSLMNYKMNLYKNKLDYYKYIF